MSKSRIDSRFHECSSKDPCTTTSDFGVETVTRLLYTPKSYVRAGFEIMTQPKEEKISKRKAGDPDPNKALNFDS